MQKLTLDLESFEIESFATEDATGEASGTCSCASAHCVKGYDMSRGNCGTDFCPETEHNCGDGHLTHKLHSRPLDGCDL